MEFQVALVTSELHVVIGDQIRSFHTTELDKIQRVLLIDLRISSCPPSLTLLSYLTMILRCFPLPRFVLPHLPFTLDFSERVIKDSPSCIPSIFPYSTLLQRPHTRRNCSAVADCRYFWSVLPKNVSWFTRLASVGFLFPGYRCLAWTGRHLLPKFSTRRAYVNVAVMNKVELSPMERHGSVARRMKLVY